MMRGETVHTEWAREQADAMREALGSSSCPKCSADLDDGECEECERSAPLDFDQ